MAIKQDQPSKLLLIISENTGRDTREHSERGTVYGMLLGHFAGETLQAQTILGDRNQDCNLAIC